MKNPIPLAIQYTYDPLDRLSALASATHPHARRFYKNDRLTTELQGLRKLQILQSGNALLAERLHDGDLISARPLMTDYQGSVLQTHEGRTAYTPYGYRPNSAFETSYLGFNSQLADAMTGHYPLGSGHRFYNPVLMRFNRADRLSPFAEGGVNSYAYCGGDPINRYDPSGNVFESIAWLAMSAVQTFHDYMFPLARRVRPLSRWVSNNKILNSKKFKKISNQLIEVSAVLGSAAFLARSSLYDTDIPTLDSMLFGVTLGSAAGAAAGSVGATLNSFGKYLNTADRVITHTTPILRRANSLGNMAPTPEKPFRPSTAQSGARSLSERQTQTNLNRFKFESESRNPRPNRIESPNNIARSIRENPV